MKVDLFKRDKSGKVRIWSIDHDNISYWTTSGIYPDGKMQKTAPTFVEQKNVGKANETSLEQQVLNEVSSKIQHQIDLGFMYEIPDEEKRFEVSLANKYQDRVEKNKLDFPYIVEPKLDGIRCYIKNCDGDIRMFSRKHKEFVACPHIAKSEFVKKFFEIYPDAILDGELYNHELKDDFNKIVSLVKKTKPKFEDLIESAKLVQYHCFDSYYPSEPQLLYTERKTRLLNILKQNNWVNHHLDDVNKDSFYLVGVSWVHHFIGGWKLELSYEVYNEILVEHYIEGAVNRGYEGIMLKKDVPYFFGRSFDMLKYKKFKDAEYKIVDFEEGKGNLKGIAAAVICETDNGEQFKAGVTGTQDYARNLYENRNAYVGKLATIKYQELTPLKDGKGGIPRFGKMMSIRDYE